MYGKDVDLVRREQQKQSYYPDPPTYTSKKIETTTEKLETDSVSFSYRILFTKEAARELLIRAFVV